MYRRKRHRRTYRKNTRRTLRKTNTLLREILLFLQSLLRQPFVKTVLLIFVILTILLVPVPWLITKITPSADPGHFGKSSQTAPFALAEIPKKVTVWHPTKPKPLTSRTTSRASSPAKCLRPFPWKLSKLSQWPPGLIPWEKSRNPKPEAIPNHTPRLLSATPPTARSTRILLI